MTEMMLVVSCCDCSGVQMAVNPIAKVLLDMWDEISEALDEGHSLEDYSKTMLSLADFCSCEEPQDD